MKRLFILSLLFLSVFSSCWDMFGKRVRGDGNVKTENRSVTGYNSIDVSGSIDVYVREDSAQSVKIETDENLLQYVTVRVEGTVLEIYPRDNYNLRPTGTIKVYVAGSDFKKFEASGACDYYTDNKITNSDDISIDLSGACDAKMELSAPKIKAELSGSGKLILTGETKDLSIGGSGSSDFRCFDMKAENVNVDISGSGDAEVFASVKLNIDVSGSGSIKYKGNPSVSQRISGSGSVDKVE